MIKCQLCGKTYKGIQPLSKHLGDFHDMDSLDKIKYYDEYMKKPDEGICHGKGCSNPTHFHSMNRGYNKYCCKSCQVRAQGNLENVDHKSQWKSKNEHIERYEKEHNCTHIKHVNEKYGRKWQKLGIPIIKISKMYQYIDNKYLATIESYLHINILKCTLVQISNELKLVKIIERNFLIKPKSMSKPKVYAEKSKTKSKKIISSTEKSKTKSKKIISSTEKKLNKIIGRKKAVESANRANAQFEIDHNCTQIGKIIEKYGQGWKALKLPIIVRNHNAHFISNEYLPLIENYKSNYHASNKEKQVYDAIKSIYTGEILYNNKLIIPPQELDIYIPDLKIAVEFNGLFWHSQERGMAKDYHLHKSLECRKRGIRLIHIYEFEDLENQIELLISLINGVDLYNKRDFNKNSLLDNIPKPELIFEGNISTNHYTIYGAGKLYTTLYTKEVVPNEKAHA